MDTTTLEAGRYDGTRPSTGPYRLGFWALVTYPWVVERV